MLIKKSKKLMSLILSMVLIVAMALCMTGCNDKNAKETPDVTVESTKSGADKTVLGEGSRKFDFKVVDKDGKETAFEIHTDKENVGEALLELKIISGDTGAYGLYVKTVNGVTLDFEKDKLYWAFYINDGYAATGVDLTPIKDGEVYSFKASK